jgi:predicted RNase H-like nuclease (RuvC/YqgF family)
MSEYQYCNYCREETQTFDGDCAQCELSKPHPDKPAPQKDEHSDCNCEQCLRWRIQELQAKLDEAEKTHQSDRIKMKVHRERIKELEQEIERLKSNIKTEAKALLLRIRDKLDKPPHKHDYKLIDAYLGEFDAVTEVEKKDATIAKLTIALEELLTSMVAMGAMFDPANENDLSGSCMTDGIISLDAGTRIKKALKKARAALTSKASALKSEGME